MLAAGGGGTDSLTAFYEIASGVFAFGALVVAYLSYRHSRDRAGRQASEAQVRAIAAAVTSEATDHLSSRVAALEVSVKEARELAGRIDTQGTSGLGALASRVSVLESTEKADIRELHETLTRLDTQGSAGLGTVATRVSVLESKMDVFWKSVALDVSKILHSPHPGWEHMDALLEKFQDEALSDGEMTELEGQLRHMVDGTWEPGEVTRADQVAASLMLHAIQQAKALRQ
jgi:hypothetical protein